MKQPVIVRNTRIGDGIPKICVPIVEKDFPSILTAARNLKSSCPDLAEWRCDHFDQAEEPEAAVSFRHSMKYWKIFRFCLPSAPKRKAEKRRLPPRPMNG